MTFLYIAIFALIGAFSRYGHTLVVQRALGRSFPFATLSINIVGSFLMGFLFDETLKYVAISPAMRTGILTGGVGTYTTFSTFSLETLTLVENGEAAKAWLYVVLSVLLSMLGTALGAYLSRNLGV